MSNDLLAAALACIKAGVSIVPIDHTTKRPATKLLPGGKWKPYQSTIADEATVRGWFASGTKSFAVVGGRVSGGLLVLDFDAPEFLGRWAEALGEMASGLPVQQTGGGGYQVLVRCPDPGGNDKLAWKLDEQEETGRTIAIETRGEGGYAVVAPSLHPSGNQYKWLSNLTAADVPTVTQAHADKLLAAARALNEAPVTVQEQERIEAQARAAHRHANNNGQASVIDAFNRTHAIDALLERHGYTKRRTGRYVRPGGKSESVSVKDGRSYHWSSNDPLSDGKAHDAFDVFSRFDHGDDVSAAVKSAADLLGLRSVNGNETHHGSGKKRGFVDSDPRNQKQRLTIRRVQPYRSFPVDMLPETVARFVNEGAAALGCDAAFFALPLLTAAGACIGNSRRVLVKNSWAEPAVLWTALVVPSGGGKSPALRAVLAPIYKQQMELLNAHRAAVEEYKAEQRKWKEAPKDERGDEPQLPAPCEHVWVSDATTEGLAVRLDSSPRGVLLAVDELAGWFLSFNQYKQRGGDKQTYLSMYDAATAKIDRKNAVPPTVMIPRAFVAICGGIQPGIFRRVCGEEDFESGLMARFLFAMPPIKPAEWTEAVISDEAASNLAAIFKRLRTLPMRGDDDGESRPIDVPLSQGARAAFIAHFNETQRQQTDEGDERMAATLAKLRGAAARLALIVHQLSIAAGVPGAMAEVIDETSMKAGIRLARWFGDEARRLFLAVGESSEERQSRELVELIQSMGGRVSVRDLRQKRRKYRNDPELAHADLQRLVDAGAGRWDHPAPDVQGGRPREMFVLVVNETGDEEAAGGGFVDVDGGDGGTT